MTQTVKYVKSRSGRKNANVKRQMAKLHPSPSTIVRSLLVLTFIGFCLFPVPVSDASDECTAEQRVKYVKVASGRKNVKRYVAKLYPSGDPISIRSWMTIVSSNSTLGMKAASDLSSLIASSSYASLFFETPGTSWQSSDEDQFEFVIGDKPALRLAEGKPNRAAYAEHFKASLEKNRENGVCSFANPRGDAILVSPLPQSNVDDTVYSHLAVFLRKARKSQVEEFWRLSASRYLEKLKSKHDKWDDGDARAWFSTHGTGVFWLHLRLDSRPKYYSYRPFM